jgi:general secretion pathway protein L
MESRFRAVFPEAVAVVDPALQMRRKLAEARHAAGEPDGGDFLPMIEIVASAMKELPSNTLRVGAYESGRLTLELAAVEETKLSRMVERLLQAGLTVETSRASARTGQGTVLITVRSS